MTQDKWLAERLAYLRGLKAPSDQQRLLLMLADKPDRTADDGRKLAAWAQHAAHFPHDLFDVVHQHQRHVRDEIIEAGRWQVERLAASLLQQHGGGQGGARSGQFRLAHVDAEQLQLGLPSGCQQAQQMAIAATKVEHA